MAGNGQDDDDLMNFVPERLTEDGDAAGNGGRSKSLLMASALIGVAVAGAAGWYVLAGGSTSDGRVSAPLIPADKTPYKVRPADPGGMKVPNQDKLVYDRLDPDSDARPEVETLLPEPAAPSVPPTTGGASRLPRMDTESPMVPPPPPTLDGETAARPGIRVPDEEVALAPVPKTMPNPTPATEAQPAPEAEPAPAPAPAPNADATPTPTASVEPVIKDAPPKPAAAKVAATTSTTETVAKAQGDYMIQLASMRSEDSARKTWAQMQERFPDYLGPLTLTVQRADLGDKGIFYRVRATGLATEEKARDVCAALAKDKVGCLFVGKQ